MLLVSHRAVSMLFVLIVTLSISPPSGAAPPSVSDPVYRNTSNSSAGSRMRALPISLSCSVQVFSSRRSPVMAIVSDSLLPFTCHLYVDPFCRRRRLLPPEFTSSVSVPTWFVRCPGAIVPLPPQ